MQTTNNPSGAALNKCWLLVRNEMLTLHIRYRLKFQLKAHNILRAEAIYALFFFKWMPDMQESAFVFHSCFG